MNHQNAALTLFVATLLTNFLLSVWLYHYVAFFPTISTISTTPPTRLLAFFVSLFVSTTIARSPTPYQTAHLLKRIAALLLPLIFLFSIDRWPNTHFVIAVGFFVSCSGYLLSTHHATESRTITRTRLMCLLCLILCAYSLPNAYGQLNHTKTAEQTIHLLNSISAQYPAHALFEWLGVIGLMRYLSLQLKQ